MEINEETTPKRVFDNSSYKERFQFQLKVNDNIICQRYFKINHFNSDSLTSKELFEVLSGYRGPKQEVIEYLGFSGKNSSSEDTSYLGCAQLIKRDLESKSRVYLWNVTEGRTKLTGFAKKEDGTPVNPVTYVEYDTKDFEDSESEFVKPGDVTFKFLFIVDDNIVYEEDWDGSQYPKYVRNSVDITNGNSKFPMSQLMNSGKSDLVSEIINRICDVCSNKDSETQRNYTKYEKYGVDETFAEKSGISADTTKKYAFTAYNREYVNSWRTYCAKKYGYTR